MEPALIRRLRRKRRRAFIESYALPPRLEDKLRQELGDDHQVAVALEGLRVVPRAWTRPARRSACPAGPSTSPGTR